MRFNIAKSSLLDAVNTVLKGMSSRSTLPILSGILIEASAEGKLTFQTTDLEISIRHSIDADVADAGKTVVPGKLFADIVKTLPDAAVSIEADAERAKLTCLGSSFELSTLNPTDFPYFPEVTADTAVELPPAQLEAAVRRVGRAVSKDESRAILTGVLFSIEEGNIRLAATDSYRLACADVPYQADGVDEFKAVIPGKIFEDVTRLAGAGDSIRIGFSDNQVLFEFGSTTFVSRKIEGTYPNYKQLIPTSHESSVQIEASTLVSAIKRVALLAQAHTPIRFAFSADEQQVSISAKTADVGTAREVIDAQVEGPDTEIAFNHQYILDGLNSIDGDVVIELQGSLKPGIIKGTETPGFLYLAMPVRLS